MPDSVNMKDVVEGILDCGSANGQVVDTLPWSGIALFLFINPSLFFFLAFFVVAVLLLIVDQFYRPTTCTFLLKLILFSVLTLSFFVYHFICCITKPTFILNLFRW